MSASPRLRYRVEVALASASALACAASLARPQWIESWFGIAPDGGDGSIEWGLSVALAAAAWFWGWLAHAERRRASAAIPGLADRGG
jgi:hypothetical protein